MCGFLAEYNYNIETLSGKASFAMLLELSKHRGPDSTEIVRDTNYQLGFNRLAILDVSEQGNQPKQSPSGRYQIVFNGEIYNFKELIKIHQLDNLKSSSDTEVLVHLCDKIGVVKTMECLNGMFAIAIIDVKTNDFYLSRDFAGIKPLFYGIHNKGVVAASQFDQIFKHPWFLSKLKLRPELVKEYFAFGYMQSPNTVYKDVFQVNPGELLHINKKGKFTKIVIRSFGKKRTKNSQKKEDTLAQVLKDAVQRQLVSDVSVATFLSGGIDSPLISAYAKKHKNSIEGFTLKVNNEKLNESEIAKAYAEHLHLKQQIVSVENDDMLKSIDVHFKAYNEPFGDYSSIPTYIITREAKKRHTVMLSGDGGDELFFGYPRMLDVLNKRLWFKLPLVIRKPLAKITNTLKITNSYAPFLKSINDFILTKHTKLPTNVLDKAFPKTSISKSMKDLYTFSNESRLDLLHQLRWNEFYAHLQRVLIKVDRASMANSLEVRVPFLDEECINNSWKSTSKLESKKDLKKVLKTLLAMEVSSSIINKKKMGFTVPLSDWLRGDLKDDLLKHVFETPFYGDSIMNTNALRQFVRDFLNKEHNNSWGVWHIYAWQKWATTHVLKT